MRQQARNLLYVVLASIFVAPLAKGGDSITGFALTKTCPPNPVLPGASFQCTFTVRNLDDANSVIDLAVTNTVPCVSGGPTCQSGSGAPVPVLCKQQGVTVTTLAPSGAPDDLDKCSGTVEETAPECNGTDFLVVDEIAVTGIDEFNCPSCTGTPLPVSGSVTNEVLICCQRITCPPNSNILLIRREILLLPGPLLPAPGIRQAMLSILDTVMRKINDRMFDEASRILGNLRMHLDGCASADGTPARNDWITSCEAQTRIRSLIDEVITELAQI